MQKTCSHSQPRIGARMPFGSGNGKIGGSCGDGILGTAGGRYAAMSVTMDGMAPTTDATSVTTEGRSVMNAGRSVTNAGRSVTIEGMAVSGTGNGRITSEKAGKGVTNGFKGSGQGYHQMVSHVYVSTTFKTHLDVSYMALASPLAENFRVIDASAKSLETCQIICRVY